MRSVLPAAAPEGDTLVTSRGSHTQGCKALVQTRNLFGVAETLQRVEKWQSGMGRQRPASRATTGANASIAGWKTVTYEMP